MELDSFKESSMKLTCKAAGTGECSAVAWPEQNDTGDVSGRGLDTKSRCLVTLCHDGMDIGCRRVSSEVESV
jgi:hypothetical protein